jgi:hypothetical protein
MADETARKGERDRPRRHAFQETAQAHVRRGRALTAPRSARAARGGSDRGRPASSR